MNTYKLRYLNHHTWVNVSASALLYSLVFVHLYIFQPPIPSLRVTVIKGWLLKYLAWFAFGTHATNLDDIELPSDATGLFFCLLTVQSHSLLTFLSLVRVEASKSTWLEWHATKTQHALTYTQDTAGCFDGNIPSIMFCQSFYPNTTLLSARTNEPNRFQVLIAIFHVIQGSTALILVLQERIRTVKKKKLFGA